MTNFNLIINDKEYVIEPALHEGFYQVIHQNESTLIGKDASGAWELILPSGNMQNFPVKEIGNAIEKRLNTLHN